jgi:cell division septal protein FtsQ
MTKKVKVKKLNVARILVFLLIIYIVVYSLYCAYKTPVQHFEISGNTVLSDAEILRELGLSNYPPFFSISTSGLRKKIKKNDYVNDAKVNYAWNFTIKIKIDENKPVFYDKTSNMLCLSNNKCIDNTRNITEVPTLLNNTTERVKKMLTKGLASVDDGIFSMINDIEYKPSYNSKEEIIDENRFLFSMNDKNLVYLNARKIDRINKYLDITATNKLSGQATIYLDGNTSKVAVSMKDPNIVAPQKEEDTSNEPSEGDINEE